MSGDGEEVDSAGVGGVATPVEIHTTLTCMCV